MRKERNMEPKAKLATKMNSSKGLRNVLVLIESKPKDEVTLFQRSTPKTHQSPQKFGRENRLEISSFGLICGPGSRANYPLRFTTKQQLDSARRLKIGDKIIIIDGSMSYRKGRVKTEIHIRNFMELNKYEKILEMPYVDMVFNLRGKLWLFTGSAAISESAPTSFD